MKLWEGEALRTVSKKFSLSASKTPPHTRPLYFTRKFLIIVGKILEIPFMKKNYTVNFMDEKVP